MIHINLRDFYPEYYRRNYYVQVPDEVAKLLILFKRREQADQRKIYRHKAYYSLDAYNALERNAVAQSPSAEEVYEAAEEREVLFNAIMALTEKQRSRLYAHFFLNLSYTEIAREEGIDPSAVRKSVQRALQQLEKNLDYFYFYPSQNP